MKSRSCSFLPLFSIVVTVGLSPLQAATFDTTGTTITLNVDNPGNQYIGNGTLRVSANGADVNVELATSGGAPNTQFYMTTGGLITIDSGVRLVNGGWSKGFWINGSTPNKADMQVLGTLDLWDGNDVYVDALSGSGAINVSTEYGNGVDLHVGVDGGGDTYSGTIATGDNAHPLQIVKSGIGTQTFNNLFVQKPMKFILNAGVVSLSVPNSDYETSASGFSGPGNLTKSGTGTLVLSGTVNHTGLTTVSAGTLSIGDNVSSPNWAIASGAVLELNFSGTKAVTSLAIAGTALPRGFYDSNHGTYGSYFSGSGSLRILGVIPLNSGVWTSLTDGNWTDDPNWQGNTIASGAGNTATFNAATGVTVTLDAGFSLGHLAFAVSDYTISGSNTLTLDAASPSITVAGGRTATISSVIAGTAGLTKLDAGLLTLSGLNTYTGTTTVTAGQLQLVDNKTGSSTFITNSDLVFNLNSGNQTLSGGSITGAGNLIKTGGSELILGSGSGAQTISLTGAASLIDVQEGTLRNDYGNSAWGGNKSGLSVASGATFNVHDGNATVDELDGSGSIAKGWIGASTLTFGVNNGSGTFSGTISNSSGNLSLLKQGTGTQILTGSNTHSGTTTVSAGILRLTNSLALQNSILDTANSIAGDATNGLQTTVTSLTLGGLSGNKSLASVFTTASGGYDSVTSLTLSTGTGAYGSYSGVIAEGAVGMTLTKTGPGALSLSGANTYPGITTVSNGVLGLQKSSTTSITVAASAGLGLVVGGAGGYTLADVDALLTSSLSGVTLDPTSLAGIDTSLGDVIYSSSPVTTRGFAKTGLNTLTLNGNNASAFGGGTTVYAGVLSFANTAAQPGTVTTVNAGAGLAVAIGGAGYFTTTDFESLWANTLPGVTLNATSLVGIDTTQGNLAYTTPASNLSRGFVKVGTGTLTLSGANAYTGGTLVSAGRLVLVNTKTGNPSYTTNAELEFNLTTGNQQFDGGTFSGTGKLIKTGGNELILGNWGGTPTVALKGADGVIDVQAGTLANFQPAGAYSGRINWAGNEAGLTVATGASFQLNNDNATVDELNGGGSIIKGTWDQPVTLTIGVKNGSGDFTGAISQTVGQTLALVKNGTGTQTLSGLCTYSGGTTIAGGTLALGASDILLGNFSIGNARLNAATFTDALGTLDVTAAATINLGSGGALIFANSNLVDWTGGTLNITGSFVSGSSIKFATNAGLTPTQLALITLNGSGAGTATLDPSGFLVMGISDPYAGWSGGAPFTGDANNDGVQNGIAWLLGALTPNVNANGLLPLVTETSGALTMTFNMLNAASRGAAVLEVQHSSDLGISDPWTGVVVPNTSGGPTNGVSFVITPGTPLNSVQATISSSAAAGGKVFGRLKGIQ